MKDWLKKLLKQKQDVRAALKEKGLKSESLDEVRGISTQVEALDAEIRDIESQLQKIEDEERSQQNPQFDSSRPLEGEQRGSADPIVGANFGSGQGQPPQPQPQGETRSFGKFAYNLAPGVSEEQRAKEYLQKCEQRGQDLKDRKPVIFTAEDFPELRAVTIGASNLVTQAKYSNILIPKFNEVSGVVDVVNAIPMAGGESYTQGFEVSSGTGDYTTETGDYADADPTFDYVSIQKAKITAYSELTDEAKKLPNADYQSRVAANMIVAIRKKLAAQIIVGAGGANQLVGIYKAPVNVMPVADVDLGISEIDETTLDKIVFAYGGDENVEGGQYLFLNKKDLAAFAAIRASTGQKLYNITLNGNVGTISSDRSYAVNFIINSACAALSEANTAVDAYTMTYGSPSIYELPVFSQIEVLESLDYKFKSGQLAFRSSVWAGGNVVKYRGFTRIKKVAAV
ncbi:phage capsid family protein [Desulfosporosinus acididurans]|uniref:Phage capsid family protein n=1 Tax=Desulfosporosinus acididurans TaxID=476652 RepID=A0A0J1FTE5_9FIRM|nr:phage major capsid protein [Desulfosporosinus acididurans]KLU66750.1 phage capsid family protein [Desulfosporosinus acididurans]